MYFPIRLISYSVKMKQSGSFEPQSLPKLFDATSP